MVLHCMSDVQTILQCWGFTQLWWVRCQFFINCVWKLEIVILIKFLLGFFPTHSCDLDVSNSSALSVSENKTLGLDPAELVNVVDHGVSHGNGVPAVPSDHFAGGEAHKKNLPVNFRMDLGKWRLGSWQLHCCGVCIPRELGNIPQTGDKNAWHNTSVGR